MTELLARFTHGHLGTPNIRGEMAGIALPFDTPDERPGISFEENGDLSFFRHTTYDRHAFDAQLALPDFGGRVKFLWQHGFDEGITSIPIGNVTGLWVTPNALMFSAILNDTLVANELRKVLATAPAGQQEVSTSVELREWHLEAQDRGMIRRVTVAQLFDVSLVVHAQFPSTRLVEVHSRRHAAVPTHDGGTVSEADWERPTLGDFTESPWDDLTETEQRRIVNHAAGFSGTFPPDTFESIHLWHHQAGREGVGDLVRRGLFAAAARFNQVQGVDDATRTGMASHLRAHYQRDLGMEPPDVIAASKDEHSPPDARVLGGLQARINDLQNELKLETGRRALRIVGRVIYVSEPKEVR